MNPMVFAPGRLRGFGLALAIASLAATAHGDLTAGIGEAAKAAEADVVAWRRDIHEHPELGMQETRTAALVAAHLRGLGMEVRTGVGGTGLGAPGVGGVRKTIRPPPLGTRPCETPSRCNP